MPNSQRDNEGIDMHTRVMVEHAGILSSLSSDLAHVKKVLDNGLGAKLEKVSERLDQFISDTNIRAIKIDSENWFSRILNKSATKIVALCVGFMMVNALFTGGVSTFIKTVYSKEPPGQQLAILKAQTDINNTLSGYHTHLMKDGKTLYHSGFISQPAWLLDPNTDQWERAPKLRTEDDLK